MEPQLVALIRKLIEKIESKKEQSFELFKTLKAHILPLTKCLQQELGQVLIPLCRFVMGSYDTTCKVWNILTGEQFVSLEGHKSVVYCIAFNNPFGYDTIIISIVNLLLPVLLIKLLRYGMLIQESVLKLL